MSVYIELLSIVKRLFSFRIVPFSAIRQCPEKTKSVVDSLIPEDA